MIKLQKLHSISSFHSVFYQWIKLRYTIPIFSPSLETCCDLFAENERETKHLMSLEGAEENLELFQIDLLDFDTLARAIGQSNGVFHLASPCSLDPCKDPQVIITITVITTNIIIIIIPNLSQIKY